MRILSVEYLRVVFISFIVLLHILWKDYGGLHVALGDNDVNTYVQLGLTNLVSLGVTGFILISGYYGVRLKINRIVSLWLQTTMYALASAIAVYQFGGSLKSFIDAPFRDDVQFNMPYILAIVAVVVVVCVVIEEIRKRLFHKLENQMIQKIDSLLKLSF